MTAEEIVIQVAIAQWETQISRIGKLIDGLTDEQLRQNIAPGKNSGVYLVGHLLAVHDAMNTILGLGERSYPHFDEPFLKQPDKSGLQIPQVEELRRVWREVHQSLAAKLQLLTPQQWLQRHSSMTDEDFEKDPLRNKLAVLINRTNHASYHYGQLILLRS